MLRPLIFKLSDLQGVAGIHFVSCKEHLLSGIALLSSMVRKVALKLFVRFDLTPKISDAHLGVLGILAIA